MKELLPNQLQQYIQQEPDSWLIDVREAWEFNVCNIDSSRLVPLKILPAQALSWDREQAMVLICHHGIRSRMACQYLENRGFNNLINLSGGVNRWAQEVDPNMPTY
jgi:rhodanese-related sulfurtransferase